MSNILEKLSTIKDIKNNTLKACKNKTNTNATINGWGDIKKTVEELQPGVVTKHNAKVNDFLPKLSIDGTTLPAGAGTNLVFEGVKDIASNAANHCFYEKECISTVSFPNLEKISGDSALHSAFANNGEKLVSVNFPVLTDICAEDACAAAFAYCYVLTKSGLDNLKSISGKSACSSMFNYCYAITNTGLGQLREINGYLSCSSMFSGCKNIVDISLDNLETINGKSACLLMFSGCTSLTVANFPKLTKVEGTNPMDNMFRNCANLTEIHFRHDMKSTIEALEEYSNNFGAENATIYFDLMGSTATLTINTTPENATVSTSIDNQTWQNGNTGSFEIGSVVYYTVTMDGYKTINGSITIEEDTVLDIALEPIMVTLKINPTPSDSTVTFQDDNGTVIDSQTSQEIDKYAWYDETTQTTYYVIGETPAVGDIVYDSEGNDTGKVVTTYSDGVISIG